MVASLMVAFVLVNVCDLPAPALCPAVLAMSAESGGADDPEARAAAELEARLVQQDQAFTRWRWGWAATFATLTVANLALVPVVPRDVRIDLYVGTTTSALAIAPLFLLSQPSLDSGPPCAGARLPCARAKLDEVARFQRAARSWPVHLLNVVFNAAAGAVLGFGYDRWASAAVTFGVGVAIGELQIFTHPRGALAPRVTHRLVTEPMFGPFRPDERGPPLVRR
jgi:hypothetical protein